MTAILRFQKSVLKTGFVWPLLLAICWAPQLHAQGYIEHSRVIGGTGDQTVNELIVDGGFSYILGSTTGNDFPKTLGSTPTGTGVKGSLTKLDASGNIVWSSYLPVAAISPSNDYKKMVLSNGVLYLIASTASTGVAAVCASPGRWKALKTSHTL